MYLRRVFRDIVMACNRETRLLLHSTISPTSIAISVPPAIAIPTFDRARAGESFVPSPINATVNPSSCKLYIIRSFCSDC